LKKKSATYSRIPLLHRVTNFIQKNRLLTEGDSILVAVSGGPDSMALLHLLFEMACFNLYAVYVDHGLRPDEIRDEIKILQSHCNSKQIPFSTVAVDVSREQKRSGASLEEAARNLRYAALENERVRLAASIIAVGHTADDQAEEILLRLIRGSGLQGLSGMAVKRDTVVRPLLQETKKSLLNYLKKKRIDFCLDSSNRSTVFLRNRVRLDLLPYLEKNFNAAIRKNLLQTSDVVRLDDNLLQQLTLEIFEDLVQIENAKASSIKTYPKAVRITIVSFLASHPAIQRRVLEKVFWLMGTAPGFRQIDQVRNLIANANTGSEIHLGYGLRVWKTEKEVLFSHPEGRKKFRGSGLDSVEISLQIDGPGNYYIAGHRLSLCLLVRKPERVGEGELLLDADGSPFPLLLRTPLVGERFWPLGASGSKKITRFLSDAKILRQHRPFFPVLVSQGKIIAIAGLRIDHDFRVREGTRRFLVVTWQRVNP
jgi:tRNA(Ile)-lysidine synthase